MKPITNLKWLLAIIFIAVNTQNLMAQSRADIFNEKVPVTWLGVDYSQTKFIGSATSKDVVISNDEFRDTYVNSWNYLFLNEQKKYDVAKALHRESVKYAIDVTLQANKQLIKKDFYSNNPSDFKLLNEAAISDLVKNYDFQKNDGIGMMFFAEGMSKGMGSMGIWVTFVDMKSKKVLYTVYETGKPGGFGFRNYWAKPLYTTLKDIEDNYKSWSKN
ncbi:hypothetical protein ACPPVU_24830 [Mucilaginibacter sp. McL0603]|uniref:hypothetical protein n=1 Tax=Mucilaginibacter sp. McL0603 TaxID=3415670 RepID=UPI003CF69506